MRCGHNAWLIEALLVLGFILGGINVASAFYTLTPITGIVFVGVIVGFIIGSFGTLALLLGGLLLAAAIVEALFRGVLFVGERVIAK